MYPTNGGSDYKPQQSQEHPRPWNLSQQPPVSSPSQHYPSNGQYPPQQPPSSGAPPSRSDRPEMATMHPQLPYGQHPQHPQHPDMYRLPPTASFYPQPAPQPVEYHRPPPPAQQPTATGQSAPRQRTAIACKYCRRRKIRCSGFENSEDGRCSNCIRFSQECVFTPVSAQTQAFVPAQALHRYGRGGATQLYGAYGQRLPPQPEGYPPPHPSYTLPHPGYAPPPPGYGPPPGYPPQGYPPPPPADRQGRRPEGPHTPGLPPHGQPQQMTSRPEDGSAPGYSYPDPSAYPPPGVSPTASGPYQHPGQQPYYTPQQPPQQQQPPRRNSPNSVYSYDQTRNSSSPHGQPGYAYAPQPNQAPPPHSAAPSQTPGRSSPQHSSNPSRAGMSINEMISDNSSGPERSAADSDMVSALNRAPRR